jgi:hypothetical protein
MNTECYWGIVKGRYNCKANRTWDDNNRIAIMEFKDIGREGVDRIRLPWGRVN